MHFLQVLVALQLAATGPVSLSPGDSAKLVQRVRKAEEDFILKWRREWAEGEIMDRKRRRQHPDSARLLALSCTNRELFGRASPNDPMAFTPGGLDTAGNEVAGATRTPLRPLSAESRAMMDRYGTIGHPHLISNPGNSMLISTDVCPIWVTDVDEPSDGRTGVDQELDLIRRSEIQWLHRRPLLSLIDSAARQLPGDAWIAGQRVRFHLEQGDLVSAQAAADECRSAEWWCTGLLGLTSYMVHEMVAADRQFQRALNAMTDADRCRWTDVSSLLDKKDSTRYAAMTCAQRDSINAALWWLADPLYLEEGNDRRAEHLGRKFLIAVRGSLPYDERWDWRDRKGGIARTGMVERYGWPTQIRYWGGLLRGPKSPFGPPVQTEITPIAERTLGSLQNRDGLIGREQAAREGMLTIVDHNNVDQVTIEYWGPQYRTVPALAAVQNPFAIADSSWSLGPDVLGPGRWDSDWWAPEFFRRDAGPLLGLPNQIAFFRRGQGVLLAAAAEWTLDEFVRPPGRIMFGAVTSTGYDAGTSVTADTLRGRAAGSLLLAVRPQRQLLGLEMVTLYGPGAGRRARFGIAPPRPLASLRRDTIALSDPMLVTADGAANRSLALGNAMRHMLPSTDLKNPQRLGVFWEVYGLAAGDTGSVALRLIRRDDRNVIQRAVGAVVGASRDSLTVRWRPPTSAADLMTTEAGITIRPGAIGLDVSALQAGHYSLEIIIERPGVPAASARREFNIIR